MQHVKRRRCCTFAFLLALKNERVVLQWARQKKTQENKDICLTSVWVQSQMFSASWAERHSNYATRHSNHRAIKSRQLCCNMRKNLSPPHVILNRREHTRRMSEIQTNGGKKNRGREPGETCNLSQITWDRQKNQARLNFLKISVVAPTVVPEMSLNLLTFWRVILRQIFILFSQFPRIPSLCLDSFHYVFADFLYLCSLFKWEYLCADKVNVI